MRKLEGGDAPGAEASQELRETIAWFHAMWDGFPGMARLLTDQHCVLAANRAAEEKGFAPGTVCSQVGDPESHGRCRLGVLMKSGQAQVDRVLPDRVRGWLPVAGHPGLCVHFAFFLPDGDDRVGAGEGSGDTR